MAQIVQSHVLKKYKLLKKVGSGAYGHVWKVNQIKTGKIFALKKIFDAFQHSTDAQRTYRQITLLHQINHDNIIKLNRVIKSQNDKDLYLVFEFMQADLHNAISQKILKDLHNRYIIYQLIKGIKYLHDANIIHRDLKPSNLLINSDCSLKICDLGLARTIYAKNPNEDSIFTEEVATRWYRAPQVLLGSQSYDQSADIWSIGCILAEILLGKPFFPGNSTLNQLERILVFTGRPSKSDIQSIDSSLAYSMIQSIGKIQQRKAKDWFKSDVSAEAIDLIQKTIKFNPRKRLTAAQILKHPYIQQFTKKNVEQPIAKIYPQISQNMKRSVKQYKKLIYEWISKIYPDQSQIIFHRQVGKSNERSSLRQRQSVNSIKKSYSAKHTSSISVKETPITRKTNLENTNYTPLTNGKKLYRSSSQKPSHVYDESYSSSNLNVYKQLKSLKQSWKVIKKHSLVTAIKQKLQKVHSQSTLSKYYKISSQSTFSKFKEGK